MADPISREVTGDIEDDISAILLHFFNDIFAISPSFLRHGEKTYNIYTI